MLGIAVSKLVTGIMLAHLCDQEYHPLSRTIACTLVLLCHGVLAIACSPAATEETMSAHEDLVLYELFGLLLLSYAHLVWNVCNEMCAVLGISVLTIMPKGQASKSR
eukprot:TRINITY_DN15387_c0_g2_i1.p2 TRINITY_DN15387_c0_g2~~TRINITY_DN15387_c0_g2_i1.p2  ORF type:complete len:107 (-),score=17.95 TRINITY_DN15387_c0_g2_i1:170-490(-)